MSRGGRSSKAHVEHPLSSLAWRKACRTLHHGSAGGPEHHDLIHGATTPWRGLAEPTGPAQVCPAYLYMVSPGGEVFQSPAMERRQYIRLGAPLSPGVSPLGRAGRFSFSFAGCPVIIVFTLEHVRFCGENREGGLLIVP